MDNELLAPNDAGTSRALARSFRRRSPERTFTLTFSRESDALAESLGACAAVLRGVADRLERGETSGSVLDENGNRVGAFHAENLR